MIVCGTTNSQVLILSPIWESSLFAGGCAAERLVGKSNNVDQSRRGSSGMGVKKSECLRWAADNRTACLAESEMLVNSESKVQT